MADRVEYVELGLASANVCKALDRGMKGKTQDDLTQSVYDGIKQLVTWVKPVMRDLDSSPTVLLITELWRTSKGRSSNGAGGVRSLDSFMGRAIWKRLSLGGRTSAGSLSSLTCVLSPMYDRH